ncbi:MAG TPA: hypothetical protein VND91_02245 [Candidatus Saccharimonadia bacterium]|nr:hypothetical protein [Candidatus Saccharimonadia bacterium]
MKIETQIRRTLMSIVALAGFGSVALVEGDTIAMPAGLPVLTANCPEAAAPAAAPMPVMVRAVEPVRIDWRVRVPATIARSRS